MPVRQFREGRSRLVFFFQDGFTLIELLLVLAVTAILVGLASPAISSLVDTAQAKAVRQQVSSLLSDARYRALSRAEILTVCHLDADHCSGDFGFPLSTFVDLDRDAIFDADEVLLGEVTTEIPPNARLDWNRKGGYLRFWPNGGTGALTGSVTYCNTDRPENDFRIVVARTGRLRIDEKDTRCSP